MTDEQVRIIFPETLKVIINYNEQLLELLTPRVNSWSPTQKIGDVFVSIVCVIIFLLLLFLFILIDSLPFLKHMHNILKNMVLHMHYMIR